jgi:ABC-type Fe3+-citrate transport system substrate-binding protein
VLLVAGGGQPSIEEIAARCRDMVVEELLRDRKLRRELLIAVAKESATKDDVERIEERMATREDLRKLEERIVRLEERVAKLEEKMARIEGELSLFIKLFIAFNVPLLVGVIGLLLELLAGKP